jgi:hypothetical protein
VRQKHPESDFPPSILITIRRIHQELWHGPRDWRIQFKPAALVQNHRHGGGRNDLGDGS